MFITAVCVLFFIKLRWSKNKSLFVSSYSFINCVNGAQQCDCWRYHFSSLVCVQSVACLTCIIGIFTARILLGCWLLNRLSKRQSLNNNSPIPDYVYPDDHTQQLNLLMKWLLGSNQGKLFPIHSLKWNPNDVFTTCKAIIKGLEIGFVYW